MEDRGAVRGRGGPDVGQRPEGTALEPDIIDPVELLSEAISGELASFHTRAIAEVLRRLGSDYEVADLFVDDQALGLS